jgi:hypothetical protein
MAGRHADRVPDRHLRGTAGGVIDDPTGWGRPVSSRTWVVLVAVAAVAVAFAVVMPDREWVRYTLAVVLGAELAYVGWVSPRQSIPVIFGWLILVGTSRRLVSWFVLDLSRDPLLLVGPAGLATLTLQSWRAGAFRRWTVMSALVAALSVVALLEVFNPEQGPVRAGLVGLLFWLIPMLWFWVGRAFGNPRVVRATFALFAAAGVLTAVYGLAQALVGFPPWGDQWIQDRGYVALFIGDPKIGGSRPFGFASSAVEYGLTVALGLFLVTLFLVSAIRRRDRVLAVALVMCAAVCFAAVAVSGVRTAVVTLFAAFVLCVLLRFRPRVPVVLAVVGVIVLSYAALWVVNAESWKNDGTVGSMRRIVLGLRNPFDAGESTLPGHLDDAGRGFRRGWESPLGLGTGTTHRTDNTYADVVQDSEFDVSNGAIAFGIAGIVLTGATLLWGFGIAAARAWRRPDLLHLATFGVLVISFRFWWNGGHYALAPLLWFALGWVDAAGPRPRGRSRARVASYASRS